ncbi:MAG: diguanylate cyclase [Deltaproteobacteria bacterium]|nr:diguanylate cyclase [Deltaproteobacteria bacterium]
MPDSQGTRARLLLVDDDHATLEQLSRMVSEIGYQPMTATTWSDALRLFREGKPDLVLLDVMMPTIDGYKLARIIKSDSAMFVPIILVTALEDIESKRRGMASGADDFLTKPVTSLELQIRLSSMLRIKELTDQLQQANAKLNQLAVTDPLTGLHNRRSLYAQLEREFGRAQRYGRPLTCTMIDIDFFKQVNDRYGHQVGDRVLRMVGDVLRATIRATDVAGRFGGEEFMILAPETGRDTATTLGERIRATVQGCSEAAGDGIPLVTVSVGIATTESLDGCGYDDLVHLADDALYRAKRDGRNRVVIAD